MKYFILLGDGMADLPVPEIGGITPLQAANTPVADSLSASSLCGMVQTVPEGMEPGSGPANMSVMGYDPLIYYTGRSPLEAVSLGIQMNSTDIVFRCNLVSLEKHSNDSRYEECSMLDYSSGEISTAESAELIHDLEKALSSDSIRFFAGRSYRHCMVWENGPISSLLTPPHDISGKVIAEYLPSGDRSDILLDLMKKSVEVLSDHPVNRSRHARGLRTADSIWLWGQGTRPDLPSFESVYGKRGAVISAVDLVFGIGRCAGLDVIEVPGATGTITSNLAGKAQAAMDCFSSGTDYVYLHVEAPDECGHQGDVHGKIEAIAKIDREILMPVYEYLEKARRLTGENYRIMFLPDHPTPVSIRTHTGEAVPFILYDSSENRDSGISDYSEISAEKTGVHFSSGPELFERFIR